MRKLSFILFFLLLFFACKNKAEIISATKMKFVMWDIVSSEEWIKIRASKDSTVLFTKQNLSFYNKIFSLHKVTKEEFYNSYRYYQNNPTEMKMLLDSLVNFGIKKRDTITNHLGK